MKIFKEIIARPLALWTFICFIVSIFICLIPLVIFGYTVKDPLRVKRFYKYSRVWMRVFIFIVGCRLKVRGENNFRSNENYIVVCNHNSFFDIFVASPFLPAPNKTIAKMELAKIPIFNLVYKAGSILVDRKSEASRRRSFYEMKEVLNMGINMCLYPEGTRNKTNKLLQPFQNGAFKLAVETQKKIIPALIFNTRNILPADKTFYFFPGKMELHILPEIDFLPSETAQSLKERTFKIMEEYLRENK